MVTSQHSINPRSIHGKIRGDSQNTPYEQHRTQLTSSSSMVSGRNTTANVSRVLYSTKAVFPRATYSTAPLRCRIYGDHFFGTHSRSRVSQLNFSSTDTVRLNLHYGRGRPNTVATAFITFLLPSEDFLGCTCY